MPWALWGRWVENLLQCRRGAASPGPGWHQLEDGQANNHLRHMSDIKWWSDREFWLSIQGLITPTSENTIDKKSQHFFLAPQLTPLKSYRNHIRTHFPWHYFPISAFIKSTSVMLLSLPKPTKSTKICTPSSTRFDLQFGVLILKLSEFAGHVVHLSSGTLFLIHPSFPLLSLGQVHKRI